MTSISRSILLAAGLLAFPLAGAVAQAVDSSRPPSLERIRPGNSTGPSSSSAGDDKMGRSGDRAIKSTGPGYESKGAINDAEGKSSGNAGAGQSGKKPAPP